MFKQSAMVGDMVYLLGSFLLSCPVWSDQLVAHSVSLPQRAFAAGAAVKGKKIRQSTRACPLDVVREHYRHVAGSLTFGKTCLEANRHLTPTLE
jgi:hypothetical protein